MKKFYLIILICSLCSCGTNRLKGVYCHSFNGGFDSTCLTFKENREFNYETSGDLGIYLTGKGKYDLKDNILKLRFDMDSVNQKSEINIEDWSFRDNDNTDTINLMFKVYDAHLPELTLYATIFEESKNFAYSSENTVNSNGALTIIKPKSRKTEMYKIGFPGYETVNIALKHDFSKEIKVILHPAQPQVISDTTHSYFLKIKKKDSFLTSKDYLYRKVK